MERGVDHGIWVPFKVMFPPERPLEVPIVQVSTFHGYDLESQIRLGEAVQSLRYVTLECLSFNERCISAITSWGADMEPCSSDGYLILGSGMAVHSFASIVEIHQAEPDKVTEVRDKVLAESKKFDTELRNAVTKKDAAERRRALLALESLPEFRRSHPTVEVRLTTAGHWTESRYRILNGSMNSILHHFWWPLGLQVTRMLNLSAEMLWSRACHTSMYGSDSSNTLVQPAPDESHATYAVRKPSSPLL